MTVLRWLTATVVALAVLGPTAAFAQSEMPTDHSKMKMPMKSEKQSKSKMKKTSKKVAQRTKKKAVDHSKMKHHQHDHPM